MSAISGHIKVETQLSVASQFCGLLGKGVLDLVVIDAMEEGGLIDVIDHPNQDRYPGQSIYVVEVSEYLYLVPFVTEADGTRFLKTIIPSRRAMRYYGV